MPLRCISPINYRSGDMIELSRMVSRLAAAALLAGALGAASAAPVVYDFDSFADATVLSTEYAGLSFTHATVLKAGQSLNESAFPPRSLDGAVFDDGGPIGISFTTPVYSVGGYFTYLNGLEFAAYDSNDVLLGTATASYLTNLADGSGDPGSIPNEFLQLTSAGGLIARVTMTSIADGASFVLDDLTVDAGVRLPEPSSLALIAGLLGMGCLRRGWLRRA